MSTTIQSDIQSDIRASSLGETLTHFLLQDPVETLGLVADAIRALQNAPEHPEFGALRVASDLVDEAAEVLANS